MAVWAWIFERTYYIGPALLLVCGWLLKYLQQPDRHFQADVFFFGTELALSGLGSLLSAFVNLSGKVDASRVLALVGLMLADLVALGLVTSFHKAFEHDEFRPRLRFFMLAYVGNGLPLAALIATLYFTKPTAAG